jgi:hypothetical protein
MMKTRVTWRRGASAGLLLIGGGAVAAATWVSGDHGWAIAALAIYAVLAAVLYVWAGRSGDFAALLRVSGDERQRGLDRDATAIMGLVMSAVAVVGAIIEIGRTGNPGVYGLFCVVAGVVYASALFALRRRR